MHQSHHEDKEDRTKEIGSVMIDEQIEESVLFAIVSLEKMDSIHFTE